MTKQKSTKRALILSALSLLLCFSMFVGTTFAWFTDSVSSVKNKIVAGNLDVELEYYDLDEKIWKAVNSETNVFAEDTLWEPGHTEVVYLKVSNLGTLALKYQLGINIVSEVESISVTNKPLKLSDYIYFDTIETDDENLYATREDARDAVENEKLISAGYTKFSSLEEDMAEYVALVVYMPEEVGNDANYKTGENIPTINLGINLVATQYMSENDSFGNDYDAGASWLGSADTAWYDESETEYVIKTAEQLAGLAVLVNDGNNFTGKTFKLGNDIDLDGKEWTAIGQSKAGSFRGTFDGQGFTVKNLVDNGEIYAGLFGFTWGATLKNVVIDNANIVTGIDVEDGYAGALVAYSSTNEVSPSITDVTVKNSTIVGKNAGAVVGSFLEIGTVSGSTVENCSVTGARAGGVAGTANATTSVLDSSVKDTTIISTTSYVGNYVGRTGNHVPADNNTTNVNNTIISGVVLIATADELEAFAAAVNKGTSYSGKTVMLTADIDLENKAWTPIGACNTPTYFQGTFDGNGYTISNLNVDKSTDTYMYSTAGLFGWIDAASATIKNVTITGATVKGSHWVGVIAGYMTGEIINCTVADAEVVGCNVTDDANGDKVGGIVGCLNSNSSLVDNTVTGTEIYGNRDIGGIAGSIATGDTATGNTVKDVKISYVTDKSYASAGQIVSGRTGFVADATNTATNVTITKLDASNSTDLTAAINAGDTDITLAPGTFTTNLKIAGGSNITITGSGNTVLEGQIATTSSTAGTITLKNLTVKVDNKIVDSTGISQTSKSAIAIWGNQTVICENVTFDMSLANSTAITSWWDTGVGTTIIVRNCTFNCNGQRPIRATGNVTVENCTFNDPYRYAVQLTAKASTATELDKAIINFNNNTIVNGENGKDLVYGIQLEGADYGCHDCVINGSGNVIVDGGTESAMYYCECGKVDHNTIEFNTEVEVVHEA